MMFKKVGLLSLLVLSALSASAIPFNTTTVGGTATVGTGGDYTTLKAAADAFNALSSPHLQGAWKLEILNDLTEPTNVAFGNTIPSGSSLTVRPAAGANPVVNFTQLTDNAGPSGNLLIGVNNPAVWTSVSTSNFIIDGSNNGTSSRDLTLTNDAATTHSFACPVVIVGDTDGTIIKNCKLINGTTAAGASVSGVSAVMRDALCPDNFQILNNYIEAAQTQGHGVNLRASGTAVAGTAMTGWLIDGNEIHARLRSVWLDAGIDGTISNNTVTNGVVGPAVTGFLQYGIAVNNGRSQTGKTLNVLNNTVFMKSANSSTGNFGVTAMSISSGGSGNTVNFINNMVNVQFTNSTSTSNNMVYNAIRMSSGLIYNIYHNSINMPNFVNLANLSPGTALNAADASAIRFPSAVGYTANVKNNILRVQQKGMSAINIGSTAGTLVLDFNYDDYVVAANAFYGSTGGASLTNHATLAAWKTATSQEANAFTVDPTATTGSSWNVDPTTADLHFVPAGTKPVELPGVPAVAGITTDIDGDPRNPGAGGVYPGADEGTVALPVSLSGFSIE